MSVGRDGASDAVSFLEAGIPAVEFGPVGAGHHGPEEWVSISSLARYRQALCDFVAAAGALAAAGARPARGRRRAGVTPRRGAARRRRAPPRPAAALIWRGAARRSSSLLAAAGAVRPRCCCRSTRCSTSCAAGPQPRSRSREIDRADAGEPQTSC